MVKTATTRPPSLLRAQPCLQIRVEQVFFQISVEGAPILFSQSTRLLAAQPPTCVNPGPALGVESVSRRFLKQMGKPWAEAPLRGARNHSTSLPRGSRALSFQPARFSTQIIGLTRQESWQKGWSIKNDFGSKNLERPKFSSTGGWISKLWYPHTT